MIYNESGYIGDVNAWVEFLDHWQEEIENNEDLGAKYDYKSKPIDNPDEFTRFGKLPKSYVDFILAGGLNFLPLSSRLEGMEKQFFDLGMVRKFKESPDFEYWINGFAEDYGSEEELEDENYFKFNPGQLAFRAKDYDSLLLIGSSGDYIAYILNYSHMDLNGEWESWSFATTASRFPSFAHLVAQVYCYDLQMMNKSRDFCLYWNREWEAPMRKIIKRTWDWDDSIA